ncbi:MAG: FAD/NAD(P)-binding protein [bacterium]|nr:FAD/NAD(P)-binding protein [bacterium]
MKAENIDPMLTKPLRIQRVQRELPDTFTLEILPSNGGFHFTPGQFNMLYVFGVGEVPISICGDPEKSKSLVHTIRIVGSVTQAMSRLKSGDTIGVRGPFGSSWPLAEAEGKDVVIVAGGIGLPPLRPAIYHILNHREKYGKVVLLYGARNKEEIIFWKELEQWRSRFDMEVHVTVDRGSGNWHGNVGVVTTLVPRATFNSADAIAMMVGPEIMMRFTVLELLKRGITGDRIYMSMERNMKCGVGICGHCQWSHHFICKDGPVFSYEQIKVLLDKHEI